MDQDSLGPDLLESSALKKDLRVLMNNKLSMSQQCVLMAKKANALGIALQVKGGDPALLSPGEATSGVLCPVPGSPIPVRHGAPGAGPAEGYEEEHFY